MLVFFEWNVWSPTAADFCEYFIEFIVDKNDQSEQFLYFRDMKIFVAHKTFDYLDAVLLGMIETKIFFYIQQNIMIFVL